MVASGLFFDVVVNDSTEQLIIDWLIPFDLNQHLGPFVSTGFDRFFKMVDARFLGRESEVVFGNAESDDEGFTMDKHRLIPHDLAGQ